MWFRRNNPQPATSDNLKVNTEGGISATVSAQAESSPIKTVRCPACGADVHVALWHEGHIQDPNNPQPVYYNPDTAYSTKIRRYIVYCWLEQPCCPGCVNEPPTAEALPRTFPNSRNITVELEEGKPVARIPVLNPGEGLQLWAVRPR